MPDTFRLQLLLATLAGWVNRDQAQVVAYLVEENHVLREQLGKRRLRLTGDQRRRLARTGRIFGQCASAHPQDADAWNQLAWFLVGPEAAPSQRDPVAGLVAAQKAVALSNREEPRSLDTLGWALFRNNEIASAVTTERLALDLLGRDPNPDPKVRAAFERALERFEAASRQR